MKKVILLALGFLFTNSNAQNIRMVFPQFAGKSYDFIIFQGDKQKTVVQGTIPQDGKFSLTIPKEYAPYTGMSRWLITNSQEGGGIDMVIPGKDFSVSCPEKEPNDTNITYKGNDQINELNKLYKEQQLILMRHESMLQATKAFSKEDKSYNLFEERYKEQKNFYKNFQDRLSKNSDYAQKFLQIVNLTQGLGPQLEDTEEKNARNIAQYLTQKMDWNALYTSGHWSNIISSWVSIYTQVLNSPFRFVEDFVKISTQISDKNMYADFAGRTAYFLNEQGKDAYISAIAPLVISSGKVINYEGSLALYQKGTVGQTAPDLIVKDSTNTSTVINLKDYASQINYDKTLLLFYASGCGSCENLLQQMPMYYSQIEAKGIHIIAISADKEEKIFKAKAKDFKWKDVYCDYKGIQGENFKNYAVTGTPTLILVDNKGKIELRTAEIKEILAFK
ncbi:AhpC/TSA family protein [Chryseobacterium sp. 7]|uniref:peroxiredoxin family protein n=1 Tax=Chryseobacterium sp. 7 TaxID=2035214 RepID=UPI000EADEBBE|nr:thioredoxin family protein [Chryseobacterium sp. 7]RLJ30688.1 AhpC/TSA family protein [Chryseobacterium sp. 7]